MCCQHLSPVGCAAAAAADLVGLMAAHLAEDLCLSSSTGGRIAACRVAAMAAADAVLLSPPWMIFTSCQQPCRATCVLQIADGYFVKYFASCVALLVYAGPIYFMAPAARGDQGQLTADYIRRWELLVAFGGCNSCSTNLQHQSLPLGLSSSSWRCQQLRILCSSLSTVVTAHGACYLVWLPRCSSCMFPFWARVRWWTGGWCGFCD
jgi:hypothetical protein